MCDYVMVCTEMDTRISNIEAVKDFDSRLHTLTQLVIRREKEAKHIRTLRTSQDLHGNVPKQKIVKNKGEWRKRKIPSQVRDPRALNRKR